jgi:hypothetical protein
VRERKDRVEDAMHATRAAVEEGVVAGAGVTLLYASKALGRLKPENDEKVGIDIVRRALQARRGRFSQTRERMPRRDGGTLVTTEERCFPDFARLL